MQFLFLSGLWMFSIPLGFELPIWHMIAYGSMAFAFSSLPLSFSGLGTTEFAFLFLFQPLGVQKEQVLALTTLLIMYKFIFAGVGWFIGSFYQTRMIAASSKNV
jgi:uncharacterized membrane protein YbhN (UPF0104 family)